MSKRVGGALLCYKYVQSLFIKLFTQCTEHVELREFNLSVGEKTCL